MNSTLPPARMHPVTSSGHLQPVLPSVLRSPAREEDTSHNNKNRTDGHPEPEERIIR